jgi:hypothetical protein
MMVFMDQFLLNIGVKEILVGLIIIIVEIVELYVLHHLNVKMVCVLKQQHVLVVVLGNGWGQQATGINLVIVTHHAFVILLLLMVLILLKVLQPLVILM